MDRFFGNHCSGQPSYGAIDKGTHLAVYYKDQNHERIATEVKAEPPKS